MRDTIVSLNREGQVIKESSRMELIDRLEFLSGAFNEFSDTLHDETGRFHIFTFLHYEFESLKSDLLAIARHVDAEERKERSESPQRAV
ncbi:hypothetical protein [Microbulbifer sp. THAF38]|uniref:hypothetical protein n=1 Tax=Microbulbifer sp. THAF38 TaxID=2587856 RepID=UPI001268BE70|nr:hypothetical protein [Microbulbifer sp. THAF38]QFT57185.1 hypothetical protein FIU95_21770 [Microbulbifer sp. THAF38]